MSASDSSRDDRFDEVIADYLDAIEAGQEPDEEDLLQRHADLAESLQAFFADHRRMRGFLGPSPPATEETSARERVPVDAEADEPKTRPVADEPTLPVQDEGPDSLAIRLGDFRLIEEIARGGMGVVYRARQESLNRDVALKMIRAGDLADPEEIRRFRTEAESAAQLDHPGIVPIYQVGFEMGNHYFSMALIHGRSLAQMIEHGPLAPLRAVEYISKVARAVHYAHGQGVIHRDIKPGNVLVDQNDEPKVTDFGLAKQIKEDEGMTMSGQILGTASYMPPEQASGNQDEVSVCSDVYSLGALLYAVTTGRAPFVGQNPLDILLDVLSEEPPAPRSLNDRIPRDLETVTLKCLQKAPQQRYATAAELADDLDRILDGRPVKARRITIAERAWRWCKRKPASAATILLSVVLLIAVPSFVVRNNWLRGNLGFFEDVQSASAATLQDVLVRSGARHCENYPFEGTPLQLAMVEAARVMLQYDVVSVDACIDNYSALASRLEELLPTPAQAAGNSAEPPAIDTVEIPDQQAASALADCYHNLGDLTYRAVQNMTAKQRAAQEDFVVAKRVEAERWYTRARQQLERLASARPNDAALRQRMRDTDLGLAQVSGNALAKLREMVQASKTGESPEFTVWQRGVIRFHADQKSTTSSLIGELAEKHGLTSSSGIEHLNLGNIPIGMWPEDPVAMYDAALEIRYALAAQYAGPSSVVELPASVVDSQKIERGQQD